MSVMQSTAINAKRNPALLPRKIPGSCSAVVKAMPVNAHATTSLHDDSRRLRYQCLARLFGAIDETVCSNSAVSPPPISKIIDSERLLVKN